MVRLLLLLVAVSQDVTGLSDHCQLNNSSYVNGCTMPLDLDIWYTDLFEEACNIHDICYFCGNEYQRSRFDCDARFLEDMTSACWRGTSAVELPLCLLFSVSFYTIVRAVSENYFIYDNSAHCFAPWVKPCITCYYGQR